MYRNKALVRTSKNIEFLIIILYIAPCVDPGVPSNGRRLGSDFGHEGTVTFQCNRKYSLVGNETIRCQDGVWSGHLPQCKGSNQIKIVLPYTICSK